MTWRTILLRRARRELGEAAAIDEREREGLGERFLEQVASVRARIAAGPEHFRTRLLEVASCSRATFWPMAHSLTTAALSALFIGGGLIGMIRTLVTDTRTRSRCRRARRCRGTITAPGLKPASVQLR
jgi:hypothetical protein